jgi:hypothetical protein
VPALVADRAITDEITFRLSWTPVLASMAVAALAAAFAAEGLV